MIGRSARGVVCWSDVCQTGSQGGEAVHGWTRISRMAGAYSVSRVLATSTVRGQETDTWIGSIDNRWIPDGPR